MGIEPNDTGLPEAIDIYSHNARYENECKQLMRDERLLMCNREIIARFLEDARLGKTIKKGARKRLTTGRCRKLMYTLKRAAILIDMPLEAITVERMQWLVIGMEDGEIKKSEATIKGPNEPYTKETANDMKRVLRKFYRWLLKDDVKRFEELTDWFDTREPEVNVQTFGLDKAKKLAEAVPTLQGRALIMLLFDGGLRSTELFNLRLRDVSFQPDANGQDTCFIRIRVSKTIPRTISLPLSTERVRSWVERHPSNPRIRDDGTLDVLDLNAQLFTWTYNYLRKFLRQLGEAELGIHLYVHKLRHCSATYYGQFLTEYQMCARYGWVLGSSVPRRYVQLSKIMGVETASLIRQRTGQVERAMPAPAAPEPQPVPEPLVEHPAPATVQPTAKPDLTQLLADPRVAEALQKVLLEKALAGLAGSSDQRTAQ